MGRRPDRGRAGHGRDHPVVAGDGRPPAWLAWAVGVDMDVISLHARCVAEFTARVATVPEDRWGGPTPCAEWDVRQLVNHVVGEDRWTGPLLEGRTIAEVG